MQECPVPLAVIAGMRSPLTPFGAGRGPSAGESLAWRLRPSGAGRPVLSAVVLLLVLRAWAPAHAGTEYLKEVPKEGEIPYGKVVYVDDKKCPPGEVKEITGGSREKGIRRKIRCVKRPRE